MHAVLETSLWRHFYYCHCAVSQCHAKRPSVLWLKTLIHSGVKLKEMRELCCLAHIFIYIFFKKKNAWDAFCSLDRTTKWKWRTNEWNRKKDDREDERRNQRSNGEWKSFGVCFVCMSLFNIIQRHKSFTVWFSAIEMTTKKRKKKNEKE